MKNKFLIIAVVALLSTSCTKTSSAPNSNAHTTPPTTTSTNTTTAAGSECVLIGHWIFDSIVFYSNNIQTSSVLPTAGHNNYVYDFTNTPWGTGSNYTGYLTETYETPGTTPASQYWFVSNQYQTSTGWLFLNASAAPYLEGYIYTLTTHQLITTPSTSTVKQGEYFYFHK